MLKQYIKQNLTQTIESIMEIEGACGAAILDARTGACLVEKRMVHLTGAEESTAISEETFRVMARWGRMMTQIGELEDMVSTFHGHQQILRPLQGHLLEGLFAFLVLERSLNSDISAMARYQLMHIVFGLSLIAGDSPSPDSRIAASTTHPSNFPLDSLPERSAAFR